MGRRPKTEKTPRLSVPLSPTVLRFLDQLLADPGMQYRSASQLLGVALNRGIVACALDAVLVEFTDHDIATLRKLHRDLSLFFAQRDGLPLVVSETIAGPISAPAIQINADLVNEFEASSSGWLDDDD